MHARLALVLAIAACGSKASPPAASRPPRPAPACLADALGALRLELYRPECGDDSSACAVACAADEAMACWQHGLQLVATPSPLERSDEPFRRACVLGIANGCTNYAAAVWVVTQDAAEYECARRLFEASCAVDDHFGCGMNGRLYLERRYGDDVARGRAILERSCTQLRGFPCRILALNHELGVLDPVPAARLLELMSAACDGGDTAACGEHATVAETFVKKPSPAAP